MVSRQSLFLLLIPLIALVACRDEAGETPAAVVLELPAPATAPPVAELETGSWHNLQAGGETRCALGADYAFYVRPADPDKVLLYFQGGGMCWFGEICQPGESATYDPGVTSNDNPAYFPSGIFDLANPANPFGDYTMIYLPACTADAHLGQKQVTYETGDGETITIYHQGYTNATTVLAWAFANLTAPDTVFVAGSADGGLATPVFAAMVASQFPEARVVQLGDASGGFRNRNGIVPGILNTWGTPVALAGIPGFQDLDPDELTFERFYTSVGSHYPRIVFAQYNSAADSSQVFWQQLAGLTAGQYLLTRLDANHEDIRSEVTNFRTFISGGEAHTILGLPQFYVLQANGVRLRDWVAGLASGTTVNDVRCLDCTSPAIRGVPDQAG